MYRRSSSFNDGSGAGSRWLPMRSFITRGLLLTTCILKAEEETRSGWTSWPRRWGTPDSKESLLRSSSPGTSI